MTYSGCVFVSDICILLILVWNLIKPETRSELLTIAYNLQVCKFLNRDTL